MPDMDMGEAVNSDMEFEDAVTALLNSGRVEEPEDDAAEADAE